MLRAAAVLFLVLLLSSTADAGRRVALVIGNSTYKHAGNLANPRNDAADMATALAAHGFEVISGFDLEKAALDRKIRDFTIALRGAEAGLFFYAGHALQVSGQNYIAPVDAELVAESGLDWEMVRLDLVHRTMERETKTNILFLDACRDNPLARNLARAMGTRSATIGRGLASIESGAGTLISFSTQPGNVALDGGGRNSPFTSALVKQITSSRNDLGAILIQVRNEVMRETQQRQVPWEHSALTAQFHFAAASASPMPTPQVITSEEERAWNMARETRSIPVLESFVARYKDTFYAALARNLIEQLKPQSPTVAATPPNVAPNPTPSTATPTPPSVAPNPMPSNVGATAPNVASKRIPAVQAPNNAALLPKDTDFGDRLLIDTKHGRIVIRLRDDIAPKHVERIKLLAREGFYDNVPFHRVIAGFMAQTGDGARGDGRGGSNYPNLPGEFSSVPFKRGTVGMARANDPNSANSQFFIMYADGASLNGKYTVVGEVESGMDALDKIKTGEPVTDPDRMVRVRVDGDDVLRPTTKK